MTDAPVRGQRRRGTPSLVLPDDPPGCGWVGLGEGQYVAFPSPMTTHPARPISVRYVGRPGPWGNPWQVKRFGLTWALEYCGRLLPEWYDTETDAAVEAVDRYHRSSLLLRTAIPSCSADDLAPLLHADVLSCWCPLGQPCHADVLCELVGRLR